VTATNAYASGEIGDEGAQPSQVLRSSGVFGIEQGLDQRGTDDHQVRETGHLASLYATGHPESDPDHRGRIRLAHPSDQLGGSCRGLRPCAGDTHE
jgi:hypothetical protein